MTAPPQAETHVRNRQRPLRRLLAAAFAASTILVLVSGFVELETPSLASTIVTFAGGMFSGITAIALILIVRLVPSQPDDKLDERLRMVRDRAHRTAYQLVSIVVLSLLLVLYARASLSGWLPDTDGLSRWMIATIMMFLATPSAVMAWTEPEP
ncbi:MAG: hypothetical protein JJT89_12600 [Nitriliruptoraceae bacterium]|nr:hypothetical protein [Nitriliruptoraceae bacterium]